MVCINPNYNLVCCTRNLMFDAGLSSWTVEPPGSFNLLDWTQTSFISHFLPSLNTVILNTTTFSSRFSPPVPPNPSPYHFTFYLQADNKLIKFSFCIFYQSLRKKRGQSQGMRISSASPPPLPPFNLEQSLPALEQLMGECCYPLSS